MVEKVRTRIQKISIATLITLNVAIPLQPPAQSYPKQLFPRTEPRGAPERTVGAGTRLRFPPEDRVVAPAAPSMGSTTGNPGSPVDRAGAAIRERDSCTKESKIPLTALMPTRRNVGTTVAANPTFFVYVPKTTAKSAEFALVDGKNAEVYAKSFALSDQPGIVKLPLPANVSLQSDQIYKWRFVLICDRTNRSQDELIQGEIRRDQLSSDLKTKLKQTRSQLEQARLYANARIWFETVSIAAELRSSDPVAWEDLLKSVELEPISREPFINLELTR